MLSENLLCHTNALIICIWSRSSVLQLTQHLDSFEKCLAEFFHANSWPLHLWRAKRNRVSQTNTVFYSATPGSYFTDFFGSHRVFTHKKQVIKRLGVFLVVNINNLLTKWSSLSLTTLGRLIVSYTEITQSYRITTMINRGMIKQNHMIVTYFPWHFARRPPLKPRPRRGSGFHAGSLSEVTWRICNNKLCFCTKLWIYYDEIWTVLQGRNTYFISRLTTNLG